MHKIAIVEKNPSGINYKKYFDFDFDTFALCSKKTKKVLKSDIDLDFDLLEPYKYIITVGAEASKFVGKVTSVMSYQGYLVENRYLPIVSPIMVELRPEGKNAFEKAVHDITGYVLETKGEITEVQVEGIITSERAAEYISSILNDVSLTHVALDTEATSLYPRDGYILGVSLSYKVGHGVYISSDCIDEEVEELIQNLVDTRIIIFHNAKFDMKYMTYHFDIRFPAYTGEYQTFEDTMLMHYVLDETQGTHGLKHLAIKYTSLGDYDKELVEYKKQYCKTHKIKQADFSYGFIPFEIMFKYAAIDAAATFELFILFTKVIENSKNLTKLYQKLLKPASIFLMEVEEVGVPFDREFLEKSQIELSEIIDGFKEKFYDFDEVKTFEKRAGVQFNPNSVIHVRSILFDIIGLAPTGKKTDTGANSVDAEVLKELSEAHPLPKIILEYKQKKKIKSTYIDKVMVSLDKDERLRTFFNLTTTTSGRLSSSGKLNMQQLPRDDKTVKKCIKAREGFSIISQDLKTAEMYIAAAMSGDAALQEFFRTGGDYHGFMAVNKFGLPCDANDVAKLYPKERQAAKTVSFEILYKLNFREPVLKKFPQLKKWLKEQIKYITTNACVYQVFGRKRRLPNVRSKNSEVSGHEIRSGVNALVQGPASDINLLAAIDMQNWIKRNKYQKLMKIFGLVHDSILAEVHDSVQEIYLEKLKYYTQMDRGVSIPNCPIGLDVEIGSTYAFV